MKDGVLCDLARRPGSFRTFSHAHYIQGITCSALSAVSSREISFPMNSKRFPTLDFASTRSCLTRTGPTYGKRNGYCYHPDEFDVLA